MKISIIIPCYNSEKMIYRVVEETVKYLKELKKYEYEFVLVNDYSKDQTFEEIKRVAKHFKYVKGINLAKNAGQHNALLAGMRAGDGDYFMGMDDDMQTHPSQIKTLLEQLESGYDIVYGSYGEKKTGFFRKLGSSFNNYTVAKLVGKPKDMKISSFWMIRKFVRDEVIKAESSFTNLQGLFLRTSAKITNVRIKHFERLEGESNYTLKKLIRLWSSVLNYSISPIRIPFIFGLVSWGSWLIHFIALIIMGICGNKLNMSMHIILLVMEFMGGAILISIGLVGEYVGRLFMVETKYPQSVIKEQVSSKEE